MSGSETHLVSSIMQALSLEPGVIAFRNNSGAVRRHGGILRYGLGVGGADIIAIVRGTFVALECKTGSQQSDEQRIWQRKVEGAGAVYAIVRDVMAALAIVRTARRRTA